jgi:methylglutaconyl-CoA hydratase
VALLSELRDAVSSIASEYTPEGNEAPQKKVYGGAAGVDERGPTRAVILASDVDSCFCAGADLKERKDFTADQYFCPFPLPKTLNKKIIFARRGLGS